MGCRAPGGSKGHRGQAGTHLDPQSEGKPWGKSSWEDHYPTRIFKGPQDAGERLMVNRGLEVSHVAGGPAGAQWAMTSEQESCGHISHLRRDGW